MGAAVVPGIVGATVVIGAVVIDAVDRTVVSEFSNPEFKNFFPRYLPSYLGGRHEVREHII